MREFLITDGESASALTRLTDVQRATGQEVTVRLAQFARFRDGKAYEFCSIIDTLGAAEQLMGRRWSTARTRRRWSNEPAASRNAVATIRRMRRSLILHRRCIALGRRTPR